MLAAYYCFVDLGWPPSRYDALPVREKALVTGFVLHDLKKRQTLQKEGGADG